MPGRDIFEGRLNSYSFAIFISKCFDKIGTQI
jgi:hypothetical protein